MRPMRYAMGKAGHAVCTSDSKGQPDLADAPFSKQGGGRRSKGKNRPVRTGAWSSLFRLPVGALLTAIGAYLGGQAGAAATTAAGEDAYSFDSPGNFFEGPCSNSSSSDEDSRCEGDRIASRRATGNSLV